MSRKPNTQGNDPRGIRRDSEMEKVIRSQAILSPFVLPLQPRAPDARF